MKGVLLGVVIGFAIMGFISFVINIVKIVNDVIREISE